jgi:TP901 family phage tail tape measure protein
LNSFVNVQIRILANQAQQQLQKINMTIQQMSGAFGGATGAANKFGKSIDGLRLDALGSRVQWIGRQLEYNFTLPLLAAGAASFKFALDNEQAFTRVTKVYGDAAHGAQFYAAEVKSLERAFESLSNAFGVAQKDTIAIAADWAAAGASGLALAKSVKLTMQTMILGEMNAADATKALIAIQAQYGFSVDKLAETISILNMVENQTGISLTGLVEGFARAAGVARSAGVDVRHLAAMLAALTPAAGSAAQAGNALKTIFSRLLSPTEETAEVLGLMGINVTDLSWQSANLVDRLNVLGIKFDALSDSQKGVVSSVVASRWQINKFEILMRELTSTTGYYQKALDSTADAQANFTQMQRELNTVLSSNPRRLQIIWTMIQNAMADVIQPAIPLLLHLANTLRTAVEWFSNLNPGVQKVVLALLAFLALIGPLIRYLGASIILVAELGKAFLFLLTPLRLATAGLLLFTKVPIIGFFTLLSNTVKAIGPLLLVPFAAFGRLVGPTLAHSWRIIITTTIVGYRLWTVASWTFFQTLRHIWIWGLLAVRTLYLQWQAVMTTLWVAFHSRILIASRGVWAFLVGGWRTALMSIVALMTAFSRGVLLTLTTGLVPLLKRVGTTLVGALFGPWGIAIGLIITLVITFWDQIVAVFNAGVRAVQAGFRALPASIQQSLLNVLRSVSAVVMKIREWLSYLNPWARHSPSLVDNVTTGVAEIIRQFSLLSNVNRIFSNAGVAIGDFAQALYDARQMADDLNWEKLRSDIAEFAPGLMGGFNQLLAVLGSLRGELASLESAYPIEAAKAMSDAIFENEMATKALQLQLMNLEDAVGPMDELQSRLDQIAGAIELLQGERESLRNAGAGSEILSQYDDQIQALNEQQAAIEEQLKPMRDLADQIKELQRQAERLSLMEALQFDPIRRQADELADAISQVEDALNAMSQAASAAQSAAGGAMSPGAQNFIAAEGGDFPDVGGNDIIGREGGIEDQAALIDQFTKDLADASSNLFGGC